MAKYNSNDRKIVKLNDDISKQDTRSVTPKDTVFDDDYYSNYERRREASNNERRSSGQDSIYGEAEGYRNSSTRNADRDDAYYSAERRSSGRNYNSRDRYYQDYEHRVSRGQPPKKKKRHVALFIILALVIIILALGAYIGVKAKGEINELKTQAYELKDELRVTLDCVKNMDPDGTEAAMDNVTATSKKISDKLNEPFWQTVSKVPKYGEDVQSVKTLLLVIEEADEAIFDPFINQMRDYPLSDLKAGENQLNVKLILSYLDFLDDVEPQLNEISDQISSVKFNSISMDMSEYSEKFVTLFETLNTVSDYKDLLRVILGNGQDRLYLVMAQNSAEIRASGGFPGSMGMITIQDGKLSVGDFSSITNYVYQSNTPEAGITDREAELFQYMYVNWAHDACYNPHFAKVAHITKVGYESRNGGHLDGIISMTPAVIQRILQLAGEDITLDDGTILTGDNATRVLQRDMYFKYQSDEATAYANNELIDPLFSQTAKQALSLMFKNLDLSRSADYINLFKTSFNDRTIMVWMDNEEDEKVCIRSGCSGNLNSDPENPVAGVYFSCSDPGRLGMFTEIDTSVSDPVTTADGKQEYTVTVTLNNYINEEDTTGVTSSYILGNNGGAIQSYVYFFAPAGGTVSDFETNNGMNIQMSDYENLQLGYAINLFLYPDSPVLVTYKVTTAEGVTTPLKMETTPTLQDYR